MIAPIAGKNRPVNAQARVATDEGQSHMRSKVRRRKSGNSAANSLHPPLEGAGRHASQDAWRGGGTASPRMICRLRIKVSPPPTEHAFERLSPRPGSHGYTPCEPTRPLEGRVKKNASTH